MGQGAVSYRGQNYQNRYNWGLSRCSPFWHFVEQAPTPAIIWLSGGGSSLPLVND
ncbi:hypothetical protein D082_00940 [Synechocystis sp. PCC 6714]|nr:hypothetical protein D082_00940 [Synechocystis sp. PCC 6714]